MAKASNSVHNSKSCTSADPQEYPHTGVDRIMHSCFDTQNIEKTWTQGSRLIKLVIITASSMTFLNEKWHFVFLPECMTETNSLPATTDWCHPTDLC